MKLDCMTEQIYGLFPSEYVPSIQKKKKKKKKKI